MGGDLKSFQIETRQLVVKPSAILISQGNHWGLALKILITITWTIIFTLALSHQAIAKSSKKKYFGKVQSVSKSVVSLKTFKRSAKIGNYYYAYNKKTYALTGLIKVFWVKKGLAKGNVIDGKVKVGWVLRPADTYTTWKFKNDKRKKTRKLASQRKARRLKAKFLAQIKNEKNTKRVRKMRSIEELRIEDEFAEAQEIEQDLVAELAWMDGDSSAYDSEKEFSNY